MKFFIPIPSLLFLQKHSQVMTQHPEQSLLGEPNCEASMSRERYYTLMLHKKRSHHVWLSFTKRKKPSKRHLKTHWALNTSYEHILDIRNSISTNMDITHSILRHYGHQSFHMNIDWTSNTSYGHILDIKHSI